MLDMKQTPHPKVGLRLEEMDGEFLLFDPGSLEVLYLNPTASLVWGLIDGKRTLQQIVDLLCETYPDAAGSIPDDVQNTLKQFQDCHAIIMV